MAVAVEVAVVLVELLGLIDNLVVVAVVVQEINIYFIVQMLAQLLQ
jgi:hypothetical protein